MSSKIFLPAASLALAMFFPAAFAFACPAGSQPATASDIPAMQAAGIPNPTVGMCWNSGDSSTGTAAAQAKLGLEKDVCQSSVNIQGLDSKFATCADKFIQQLRTVDSSACIESAYRSVQDQAAACVHVCGNASGCPGKCAPPGHSYHQKGLAIDIKSTVSNQQLWQTAQQSGLYNPSGLHVSDPRHLQADSGSICSAGNVPAGDTGDYYGDTNGYFQSGSSLPFDNSLRQSLGISTAPAGYPMQPAMPSYPSYPAQSAYGTAGSVPTTGTSATAPSLGTVNTTAYPAGTCQPQTYCSQQNGNIYYRANTCVDQLYEACSNGCSGLTCTSTSTASTNSPFAALLMPAQGSMTSQGSGTSSSSASTSPFDLIAAFANAPSVVDIATATPVDISSAVHDTSNASVMQPSTTPSGPVIQTPPQGSGSYGPMPQQTFMTGDLANSPQTDAGNAYTSNILEQMRSVLLAMARYLQPFGTLGQQQYPI